ncbi:DUF2849 domain-containing protein [Rhodovulum sulfidophilum]|uniref:DUF2849 domain-containing protein n=1 Tax=Rhodovulum sulfidophilum TaxID=35806 RepID=UPI0019209595|nr:DUF2849 domain-containing protein [Rhodovulum sulfidophilum]MBL3596035.1 DUF2849 domain-containing protein [Rhodovulum sulfidophilum]
MKRRFNPSVVTANDLFEGHPVWRTAQGRWSATIREAEVLDDPATAQARLAEAETESGRVVGPYLAEVAPAPQGPAPLHFREVFRVRGPAHASDRPDQRLDQRPGE